MVVQKEAFGYSLSRPDVGTFYFTEARTIGSYVEYLKKSRIMSVFVHYEGFRDLSELETIMHPFDNLEVEG